MNGRSRWTRRAGRWARRHAPALAAVSAICLAAIVTTWSGAAIPAPGWTVTATSATTNLVDGQRVTINIKANADVIVSNVQIQECRKDGTYVTQADMFAAAGNCPANAVSSSSSGTVVQSSSSGIIQLVQTPDGANITYRVGTGVVQWQADAGPASLTCDETHDCALVVQLRVNGNYLYSTIPLSFASADPIAGCGGPAPGVLTSAAGDRLSDAWPSWTKQFCALQKTGAPSGISYTGEGEGVASFARGDSDLAYSAFGYDKTLGFTASVPDPRAAVPVPIAVGAAVLGVGGGATQSGVKVPYAGIALKASEIAAMIGGGNTWLTRDNLPYAAGILSRNPQLKGQLLYLGGGNPNPIAASSTEGANWLLTHYLATLSPTDFVAPRTSPVQERHAAAALATASPDYQNELNLLLGRPAVSKVLEAADNTVNNDGPVWVVTDLASATALGMAPVAIENAAGQFVAPTVDSITAAVPTMKPDENGMLVSDPSVTTVTSAQARAVKAAADTTPYPLTFVEYAMVPAEPLVNPSTCGARTNSQELLTQWLNYLVGAGQKTLPDGYAPLPLSLVDQAKAQIAKVGAAPVTGPCAGKVTSSAAGDASGALTSAGPGFSSAASPIPGLVSAPTGVPGAAVSAANAAAAKKHAESIAAIPAFVAMRKLNSAGIALALIGIVVVTSLGASLSGKRNLAFAGGGASVTGPSVDRGIGSLVALWCAVAIAGVGLVVYQLGPLLSSRDQRQLLSDYRTEVSQASHETQGLAGVSIPTKAPDFGTPVGVLEVGALRLQNVVVEGVSASQTSDGPGHVPGTAGLGQPGNSVVVGRRNGYGGAFAELSHLGKGDRILVTTTQGQSVYSVTSVSNRTIVSGTDASSGTSALPTTTVLTPTTTTVATGAAKPKAGTAPSSAASTPHTIKTDDLYGPSKDDRLTLVTSASRAPWNTSDATIAVAKLVGKPYAPTPQNGRTDSATGTSGESGAWAGVVLALLAYVGCIVGSIAMYRRFRFRVAYLLTIAPLVALTIVVGEAVSRLLPAWT